MTKREGDSRTREGYLQKSGAHLRAAPALKYAFIAAHQHEFPIKRMCEVLCVSESGYYAWRNILTQDILDTYLLSTLANAYSCPVKLMIYS